MKPELSKLHPMFLCLVSGVALAGLGFQAVQSGPGLDFEPNIGSLKGSPYGRTVGLALQGPVVRFLDKGICRVEATESEDSKGRLYKFLTELKQGKDDVGSRMGMSRGHEDFVYKEIERKLELAWEMDPRNYSNYAIYQMFLYESFANKGRVGAEASRALSLATLQACLADEGSPLSLLTGAQAAFDLVLTGSAHTEAFEGGAGEVEEYSKLLPQFLESYERLVVQMQEDGRWNELSEIRQTEFEQRRLFLERLSLETENFLRGMNQRTAFNNEGRNS
ncbi:MAG: hypothetical protein AAGC74_03610 [Verrucomicrobiota bacterium]